MGKTGWFTSNPCDSQVKVGDFAGHDTIMAQFSVR